MQHFTPDSSLGPSHQSSHSAIIHVDKSGFPNPPYDAYVYKAGLWVPDGAVLGIWTSTKVGDEAWQAPPNGVGGFGLGKLTDHFGRGALCARAMEPDLLQMAKDAAVTSPVPNLQTLKADVPLTKAQLAYKASEYQEVITQAQASLAVQPNFAPAYWAMGIAYGRLGQWDVAVTNLEASEKADKNFAPAKSALQWAKQGQKAAKSGGSPKDSPPTWN